MPARRRLISLSRLQQAAWAAALACVLASGPAMAQRAPFVARVKPAAPAVEPAAQTPATLRGVVTLDPRLLLQLVVSRSAEIEYSKMQIEVSGQLSKAEAALYELVFYTALRKDGGPRQRTVEERITSPSTSKLTVLHEQVTSAESGVKWRLPTGADMSASYRMRQRSNNIIASASTSDTEYDGALIMSFKQPLLKGFGRAVTETDMRVAADEQEIALWQYRQQMMKTCNDALGVYWQLYRAIEVKKIRDQALDYGRQVAVDTAARIRAGKLPSSNMIEAQAAVLLREVEQIRAEQGVREAESRLQTLLAISGLADSGLQLVVRDDIRFDRIDVGTAAERYRRALDTWPALRIARLRAEQAGFRLNYAANQTLPSLDLVLMRTNTGLSTSAREARQLTDDAKYREWSIGLNFEMPLGGGQKARAHYNAQEARVRQAQIEVDAIHTALGNDIRSKWEQAIGGRDEASRMGEDVTLRSEILRIEKVRYDSGLTLLSQLLQREAELSESRLRLLESNARLGQANDALLFADGTLLQHYGITVKE